MKLKILSWNIWIKGHFDQIADFLKTSDADIIGLQEVQDGDPERDIVGFLKGLGYQYVFAPIGKAWGGKEWNDGPAIFSRYKIIDSQKYTLSEQVKRTAIRADIKVRDKILHVFSTHLVHTHQQPSKEQDEQAAELLNILTSEHTIVMGDFNVTPNSTGIQNIRNVLVDSDPSNQPTWSVYPEGCPQCNPQAIDTRLDYIFTSKDIKTTNFKVENSRGSDHLPISVIV